MPRASLEVCAVEDCERLVHSRGYCRSHYERLRRLGDPLAPTPPRPKIKVIQCKVCVECGRVYEKSTQIDRVSWAKRKCCSASCGNAWKARGGRPLRRGELSKRVLGVKEYRRQYRVRQAMPHWAEWWEQERRTEDVREMVDIAHRLFAPGPTCRLSAAPTPRYYVSGTCGGCGQSVTVKRGLWHEPEGISCRGCTKKRWRLNHRQRAKMYGAEYEYVDILSIFKRDAYVCQLCGDKTDGVHPDPLSPSIDHIVPLSRGGTHTAANLQTAHLQCNVEKGARTDIAPGVGGWRFERIFRKVRPGVTYEENCFFRSSEEVPMSMEVEEMRTILEDIARDAKNGAARIAAIRQLRELDGDDPGDEDGFDALDAGDELAPRRRKKVG